MPIYFKQREDHVQGVHQVLVENLSNADPSAVKVESTSKSFFCKEFLLSRLQKVQESIGDVEAFKEDLKKVQVWDSLENYFKKTLSLELAQLDFLIQQKKQAGSSGSSLAQGFGTLATSYNNIGSIYQGNMQMGD